MFLSEQITLHWVEVVPITMSFFKTKYFAALALAVTLCLVIAAGCAAPKTTPVTTTAPGILTPGPNDSRIAYRTAQFMENLQYSQQSLDTAMSEKFFDGYLGMLDPRRENLLQSDIDEFAHYRTNLDKLTLGGRGRSDLTPAYEIFARVVERMTQHTDYVNKLLKQDHFKFDTGERITLDRRHAPYPKDLAEAQELWRQQLRYDYLQARLDLEFSPTNGNAILPLPKSANTEITGQLEQRYNWILHYFTNWGSDNVLQAYLNALTHAYDPHTDYLNEQHAADFRISMSLQLGGIGAQLSEDYGYCTIDSLIPGGPADKSRQINKKDRVIAVAQSNQPPVNVVDMELPKVVELIRGPKGTQVRLTIEAKDDPASRHVVVLTRDEIKLEDQEAKARLIEIPDGHGGTNRIGLIDVPSFYAPMDSNAHNFVSVDVARLIKKLEAENVGGIILDMRNNPGGSLEEAIQFTGLFIKEGPVVLARNTDGQIQVDTVTNSAALYSGPLVVMINRFSASAAEIAAAALQDYGRAVIVGDISTHGKGTVQSLTRLNNFIWPATPAATNDPGTLKITIRKFYRINGTSTQLKGVEPNIVLPDVLNVYADIGESALDNALPCDTNAPVDFQSLNIVQPNLAELRQRSETRIATNQDFQYIRQDIAQYQKLQADKTATLNEQEAIKQRQAENVRKDLRAAERAGRPLPDEKIYDITLENSDQPGLAAPEPMLATNGTVLLIATNQNGSVSTMTTNHEVVTGILLDLPETNAPAAKPHCDMVITKAQTFDPALDESEGILEDYVSLLSKKGAILTTNH
jgi:carboxyl-terminal processing protease